MTNYGAQPDTELDTQVAMTRALQAAAEISGPVVLDCPKGSYHFYVDEATRAPYYISNTTSETENPDVTKTIGILLKGLHNFTLEGNGSLFIFHGKQTMILLDGCSNVELRNLHTDYYRPTVTEMTIVSSGAHFFDTEVHPDSRYEIRDGRLVWIGEGWSFTEGPMQTYDPVRNTTWRMDNWLEQATSVEELEPMKLRLHFDFHPEVVPGHVLQNRDGIRDQVGVFITESSNVTFMDVGLHFLHGLGVVGQFSENLTFRRMDLSPRAETGRTVAGFADFIHMSSCRGKVTVADGYFAGSHDDPVNVHGTYLRIVEQPAANVVKVRFMHHQTYGFLAFHPGDEIEFVRSGSLISYAKGNVVSVESLNPRELLLTLADPAPEGIGSHDVIENVTWTAEVEVVNNHFARVPTRGVLVTSRRKAVIANNTFERMHMNAVLIAVDAESWYESGKVEDVTITGNRFVECGSGEHPVIFIAPENVDIDENAPVHQGIIITGNRFELKDTLALSAKSTSGLVFQSNEIVSDGGGGGVLSSLDEAIVLTACSGVDIADNTLTAE
ncbi:right-handed parallel beta-helix repeat-containing protein [Bacillus sp. FJAT-27264]|uniref:right-handed parallel beta-helix repeat-containing protein n=1 Tax=Paenibacillus sp. (strain DSM 101736 / FJAT-27264) TaxID=1850362 RepID=UPI000A8B581A|nr:right-handed parallel beta-helix repeat-containing protein [Bacillus sp. FJAT-27264]